nr:MAG TPA: TREPONEMA DENTICOLA VARIABLE PROTEIN 1 FUNCTION, PERIODONTAL DISEASE [Caudoviricetes sp.]
MWDVELEGLDEVPQILFDLEILPPDWKERQDGIYVDSELKEAVPFRGSSFSNTSSGGASAVHLNHPRSLVLTHVGFRSALYLKYSKPTTE